MQTMEKQPSEPNTVDFHKCYMYILLQWPQWYWLFLGNLAFPRVRLLKTILPCLIWCIMDMFTAQVINCRPLTVHQSLLYFLSAGHHKRPILNNCLVKGLSSNLAITDSIHMKKQESKKLRTKISSVSPSDAVTATPVSWPPVERTRVWKASCGKVSEPMDTFPFKTWKFLSNCLLLWKQDPLYMKDVHEGAYCPVQMNTWLSTWKTWYNTHEFAET